MSTQVYLPMDCPVCGRHRVEWNGKELRCEKCTTSSDHDGFSTENYKASRAQAARIAELEEGLKEACDLHRQIGIHEERLSVARERLARLNALARGGAAVVGFYDAEKDVKDLEAKVAELRALAEGKP